jgi:hypothetical protein
MMNDESNVKNNKRFTKIPNIVLYTYGNKDKSVLEEMNYNCKTVLIIDYLYTIIDLDGISRFSLEDMIISCGYKTDTAKGGTNEKFKSIMVDLVKLGCISCKADFNKVKIKDLIKCKLKFDISSNFSIMYKSVKEKIYSVQGVDKAQLFTYYCYINARMHRRGAGDSKISGEYEYTYFGFDSVYNYLKITDKALVKYNDILVELDLIRYKNFGATYHKDAKYKTTRLVPNFYTLFEGCEERAKRNLNEGFKLYKYKDENDGKKYTDKPLESDNRVIGGKKGSLVKKEMNGTITDDEMAELIHINDILGDTLGIKSTINDAISEIEDLDDIMSISEYFTHEDIKKGEKYKNIEYEIGLVDKSGNLCVDFNVYKDIMKQFDGNNTQKLKNKVMQVADSTFDDLFA